MARDYFDESKNKKKVTKKKTEVAKPQSSSVTKPKTTKTKVDKVASKSTFLGGGAPVQKVEQAVSKPKQTKPKKNPKEAAQSAIQRSSKSTAMGGTAKTKTQRTKRDTTPVTSSQRKANAEANMNLKQRNIRDTTPVQSRRTATTTAAQRQKMGMPTQQDLQDARASRRELANSVRSSVREATSETNKGFMQRQKSGTLTTSDKKRIEQTNQRRAEIARNTGAVAKKAVQDTVSGYGQSLADVDELAKSNKNWTTAKAQKMGIDLNDKARVAKVEQERQQSIREAREFRQKLFDKQEQRQAEWDERTKNAKGLEKAWYGAVESGTGMVADTLVGAATGTGQFGALASMGLRTYGPSANQARKEGATDKEARLYGLAQSAKEVGTELMFQGAGLAKAAYGKTGLSLADKSANILTKGLTGLKADAVGAGVRALGGTAEENIEELAGWMADPLIKELTYGKAVRNRMKENLRANIPQIGSDADAANVASYFSTPKFTNDLTNEYVKSGMSRDKASALAAEMRDYYVAYYSGDKGRLDALEEDLAAKLSGQDKLSFRSWSMDELKDTFASTTLLTLATGLPGAVTTSVKGNQIFDSDEVKTVFGNDAVRKVADAVKNTSNREMSLKAETMEDRLNSGKDLTGTQKYDLYQGYIEKVNETSKKARASQGVVENARREQNLVPTMGVDRAGNTVYAKETQREYDEKYAETAVTAESLRRFMESDNSISDDEIRRTDAAIKAVSDLHVGGLTIGDAHEFAYGNNLARETLKIEEGIDLDKYIVRKADGTVDLAATNEATENALFQINADNAIKAAQAETEVFIDDTRGNIDKDLLTRFGNNGQAVWKEVNKDLDPRDLKNYLTNANAAEYFYSAGRNTDMSVDTAVNRFADTFKTVDKSVMKRAFAAGARDRIIANTPGYGQTVESGSNIQLKKTGPVITGQLIMDDDVVLADSDQSAYLALAMSTNTNIHIVSSMDAMGKDGKPIINQATGLPVQINGVSRGNDIFLNVNAAAEKNLGYVFMHEMTHQIKQYAPNEYLALENLVRDRWFNKNAAGMQATIKQRMDLYSVKGGQQLTEEEAVEEIIADAMAEAMDDPNFAAEVCEQDINLGQAILNSIKEALRSIRQIFANSDFKNDRFHNSLLSYLGILDEAEKMWLNALHTARQNKADGLIADWQDKANKQDAPRLSVTETDSEGNTLSEGQREFFKDSKVRDDDGNLLRMYHGTYEEFTVFEPNEFVEEQNGLSRIKGYFSTSEDYSSVYGDTTPYYLNMKNPLFIPDESKRLDEWKEWFAKQGVEDIAFDSGIEQDGLKGYGFEDGTKGYALWELFDTGDYWYGDGNLTERIEAAGYDGIYWHEGEGWNIGDGRFVEGKPLAYMPFNQNAIKRADNLNPTEDVDTRYSLSEEDMTSLNDEGVDLTESGSAVRYSLESWQDTDIEALKEKLRKAGFDDKRIDKWIKDVNSIAALITGDMARLNYTADQFQDALKPNAEYFYTLDLSTLCQKRRLYQGTYNKIMRYLVNNVLLPEDTVRLRAMMDEMGYQVPCGICYEESRKKNEGKFAERWLNGYGKKWKGYKNQEHTDPYIPTLYEVTTTEGREKLREEHPEAYESYVKYQKTRGSANPKISYTHTDYRGDILRMTEGDIQKVKHIGGLRIQSFSDFEIPHVIDMMQAVMDMSAQELTAQAYTKVPAFAKIFGGTGIKINLSLIGRYNPETDQLEFDAKEGIDPEEAFKLRDKYSKNVGTILVGSDDVSILKAWADPRVDMVIPFHRSGWSKKEFEKLGLIGYKDYTKGQTERYMMGKKDMALSTASKALGLAKEEKLEPIYSADYWDENLSGKENAERYLALCAEKHYRPVFYQFLHDNGDGTWSLQEDGSTDGYWKSLIDFKMYDNEGNFAPQELVQPTFDMVEAEKIMGEYEGGADTLPVADDVVEAFLKEYKENHPKAKFDIPDDARLSIAVELDDAYNAAVESNNMDEAQRLVDEAAKAAGYTMKAYHGTTTNFNVFSRAKWGENHDGYMEFGAGFYFTPNENEAQRWAERGRNGLSGNAETQVMSVYLNADRVINADDPIPGGIKVLRTFGLGEADANFIANRTYRFINYLIEDKGFDNVEVQDELKYLGYDAVDATYGFGKKGQFVVFNPEQIKSADPVTYAEDGSVIPLSERFDPTNNDIRYSLPTQDSDGNILTDGQMEYFKNSQARDEQGRLVPVYHTTNRGGFTVFDPQNSQDGRSLFFASNKDASLTYGASDKRIEFSNGFNPISNFVKPYDDIDDFFNNANILFSDIYKWDSSKSASENMDAVAYNTKTRKEEPFDKWVDDEKAGMHNDDVVVEIQIPRLDSDTFADRKSIDAKNLNGLLDALNKELARQKNNAEERGITKSVSGYYEVYLNLENPLIIDANGAYWDNINYDGYSYNTRELAAIAQTNDYDGVIVTNCIDVFGGDDIISDIYIAFSSNQVKDINNENPSENPDIRYSITPEDEAKSKIAYDDAMDNSYELLAYYEQQLGNVNPETFDVTKAFREEDVVRFLDALKAEDSVPSDDPKFEEDRVRRAKSKEDFYNNVYAKWNDRWTTEGEVLKISSVKRDITNLVKGAMANSGSGAQYRNEIVRKTLLDARIAYQLMKQDRTELASYLLYHSAQRMIDGLEFIRDDTAFKEYKEIRDYLRTYRINAPEEYWHNVEFNDFRKEYYGRLRIGKGNNNIEDVYRDLADRWPHLFNEAEREKAGLGDSVEDLLQHIGVVVDSNVTPFMEAYSSEEAASLAYDLADQLYEIIANGDREVSLADSYKERYDAKTKALKARHAEAILRERKIREEGIRKERIKFREYKETQKEKTLHTKYFTNIKSKYDELTKRLLTNTKEKHIPEQYKRELAELLKAFDFQTVGSKKREARTGYKAQNTIKLEAMRTALERIEANSQLFHINDSITEIMKDLLGLNEASMNKQSIEGKTLDELNASELRQIDKLLGFLIHEFNNYEKVRVGVKKQQAADIGHAQNDISLGHADQFGPGRDYQNTPGWVDKILNLDEMTAAYLFKRIDPNKEGLGLMYGEIRKSFDKYVRNQNQLNDWMEEIVGKYHNKGILWNKYGSGELSKWRSTNYAQKFDLTYGTLELTPAQMMSVACLANRKQAYDHMIGAGVVVAPVSFQAKITSDVKKKINKSLSQKLTDADIKTIEAALTPEQRQVANKLQELMATKMAAWGNEASVNVLGIKLFEDPDYFPIRSDRAGLTKDLDPNQFEQAIRNFGFTKAVQPGARNAIMIDDIFDVVTEHCNNMNLYNSYTEAMNDFMKVYNYREVREDGEYTVEQALRHAFSDKTPTFIMQFMRDLNGNVSRRASGIEDAYNSLLGNAKKAAVFANLRVAAQQPTAITRAFAVINPKYLKGIRIGQGDMKEMFEHCPIALWKSWGYYDINMGKSIEDIMMNNGRWLEDKATDLYGFLDNVTWTAIWQMVKAEMKDTHPDVKIGTDEYWELCNERMSEIVDLTQVVDSPMHRSHAMRDKGFLKKTATAFMAEPTLTFNMIRDGWISAREAWKRGDKAEAEKIKWRTVSVALLQAATVGGLAAIVDALRKKRPDKDDDDERFLHLWWVNALENFKNELELWNKVYFVKDIASIFEGWENSNLALQGIQKFALGYRQLTGDPYARSSAEWYENMADGIGYMWGIPVKTIRTGLKNAMDNLGLASPFLESVGDDLSSMASDDKDTSAFIGSLLSDEDPKGMFGKLLTTKSDITDSKERSMDADDLPDNLTDEQKEEIIKSAERRSKTAKSAEEQEKRDYDTMLYDAMKAASGYEGEKYNKKIWESVSKGYKAYVEEGNYERINMMRRVVEEAGGDLDYFDKQVNEASKTALKKSIKSASDMTEEEYYAQKSILGHLRQSGMTDGEISEYIYKSDTRTDLQVAMRINDEDAIFEELTALVNVGFTQQDFEKAYKNRNRVNLKNYKDKGGKYADRLKSMGTFIWPTDGVITSHFGYRNAPTAGASSNHPAIDIGAPQGTAVVAADGGVVISAGANGGYGNSVGIKHDNGMITWYNHLYDWNVKVGDTVAQGQQIAQVGSTGISTGPHLDFKIMDTDGNPVDPEKYLEAR